MRPRSDYKTQIISTSPVTGRWSAVFVHGLNASGKPDLIMRNVALWAVIEFAATHEGQETEPLPSDEVSPVVASDGFMLPAVALDNYLGCCEYGELQDFTKSSAIVDLATEIATEIVKQEAIEVETNDEPEEGKTVDPTDAILDAEDRKQRSAP